MRGQGLGHRLQQMQAPPPRVSRKDEHRLTLAIKRLERKAHLTGHTVAIDRTGEALYG